MGEQTPEGSAPSPAEADGLFVVGLGASAGGIEALKQFFAGVGPDTGTAYVVILHLSPNHDSSLAAVLQHTAAIPVTQVVERVVMAPDHVYVVPPNKLLTIDRNSIVVSEIASTVQRRSPVDLFFRSLADAQGSRAACVVLSGTGPNGSGGLKRVKEHGGLTIAQDPHEAAYQDMPRNAIATGLIDFVLPVAEIPGRIRAYQGRVRRGEEQPHGTGTQLDPGAMREIMTTLRTRTGHDFSNYKPATIQRRIERRMQLRGLPAVSDYGRMIRAEPEEVTALMRELLISVTHFFRDEAAYDSLALRVVPSIFMNRPGDEPVRVWVPACATGEEAYSIAILLAEHAASLAEPPAFQVFATDLDDRAVGAAREALYSDADVADVSDERITRFFTREPGGFRVQRSLRERVLFAHHNLLSDPPFSHLDLISCRNLLIYLNPQVQQQVVDTFRFALRPGGYLFLGTAESPDGRDDFFTALDKTSHIYERRRVTNRPLPRPRDPPATAPGAPLQLPQARQLERTSALELHHRLLERYGPPSVVITDEHNVVHMSENVGRFLQVAAGEPTRDLLRMVPPDLRADLRAALHRAVAQRVPVAINAIRARLAEGVRLVDLSVRPALREDDPTRGYLLVTFADTEETAAEAANQAPTTPEDDARLGSELGQLKAQLDATIEQYEARGEESKAANQELQAMNEELRSAAEELETSKEELQSVNEELTTVNQELKIKIEELGLTNNDFQNLINAGELGTIFLDRDLRVKFSTPTANQIFNLMRSDVGRPLSHITSQLIYEDLHADVEQVLADLRTIDREAQTRDGRWIFTRIRPYRTVDDRIEGIVLTFQDITERHSVEERLRENEERLRLLVDCAVDYAIFTMTVEGMVDSWNAGAERMFGYRADEIIGQPVEVLFTPEDRAARLPERELRRAQETGRAPDERFHVRRDGSRFYCSGVTTRLGERLGFAKIARDLSANRQATDELKAVRADLELRVHERTDQLEAEVRAGAAAHAHVTELLRRNVTAQEDERGRIARDLHDQLGQQLTALRLSLQRHRDWLAARDATSADFDEVVALADGIDHDIDFLSWQLRPAVLDDLGLTAALPLFVEQWSAHYRIPAEYHARGISAGQIGPEAEITFYRVAQEAMNNIIKHAHASRVDVLLESRDDAVLLVVEDDGIGFDPGGGTTRDAGIGIAGMQERARLIGATLQVESKPGAGTSVFLRCPASGEPEARS